MSDKIPTMCPVAYGPKAWEFLQPWLKAYAASGTPWPVVVMTDHNGIPECAKHGIVTVRIDTTDVPCHHPQQIAGWLKASAGYWCGKAVAVDCDLYPLKDMSPLLEEAEGCRAGMCPDGGNRTYPEWPEVGVELNSGLIYQDGPEFGDRYKLLWTERGPGLMGRRWKWGDEIAATWVAREMGFRLLSKSWNFSHWWWDNLIAGDPVPHTIHGHGPSGKAKAKEVLRRVYGDDWEG